MDDLHVPWTRDSYAPLVSRALWENLPQVIGGGLLFGLLCAPAFVLFSIGYLAPTVLIGVITVAPAWSALLVCQRALLNGEARPNRHFWPSLRRYWRGSIQLGLVAAFPILATLVTLPLLAQNAIPPIVWLGLAADGFGMALMAALLLYAFPVLVETAHREHPTVWGLYRRALHLASRHLPNTLGLMGMGILFGFAVLYISWGLLLITPAVFALFVASNALLVLQHASQKS
ncbi:MAG: DUF624 domain-containing protein [Caldilineaceae bacterium]|nr:DUF624 domain-containing protein [Caldilineaceae bacterium]